MNRAKTMVWTSIYSSKASAEELSSSSSKSDTMKKKKGNKKKATKHSKKPTAAKSFDTTPSWNRHAFLTSTTTQSSDTSSGIPLTATQADMLQEIQHRDEVDIDRQLDELATGMNDLQQIAMLQGEEVAFQNQMLDQVNGKTDKNQSKLARVMKRFR